MPALIEYDDSINHQQGGIMAHSPASEKQIAFIAKLINDKDIAKTSGKTNVSITYISDLIVTDQPHLITKVMASDIIDQLKALPYKTGSKAKAQAPAPGYYTLDNKVYKVVKSPNTGNSYAKVFTDNGWEYAAGMATKVSEPLTLEAAKEFGHIYGACVICGRTLTDEESIAAGIGPICAGKMFG
jgi:hypothetical protein